MSIKWKLILSGLVIFVVIISNLNFYLWRAPASFPVGSLYTLEKGKGVNQLTSDLIDKEIVKSAFWFKVFSVLFGGPKGIMAGDYVLFEKQNLVTLAYRFSRGDYKLISLKITFPEGLNTFEVAKLISQKFPKIDEKNFIELAKTNEGYLFPDTYLFLPNISAEEIIAVMRENFNKRIEVLLVEINKFNEPVADVIKMASIVEEEARTFETREIVAGILWQRLNLRMPLQVDSSFKYINGKTTATLTTEDLKIDSPYNSYLYRGLPPTPISNPGLESIKATVNPIKTDYLYFLSDKEGNMHYAKTYAGHLQNKELYLK